MHYANLLMKYNKIITLFLGVSMFMFGILKFFNPFKGWYSVQIYASGLGDVSYVGGIAGELIVGVTFLIIEITKNKISFRTYTFLSVIASITVMVMMVAGTFVHLHPDVPADVLPLNIKPPFIPLFVLALALANIFTVWRNYAVAK